jgi:tetratricopeptide (TPR) repeat protein
VFWNGAVAVVGERERDDARRDLNELVHREFVRPVRVSSIEGEEEFSFWHALVRDVAYQQIPRAPRAEKHLAAARWVEETAAERVADHAEILVYHCSEALELVRAAGEDRPEIRSELVRFLLLAGDRAAQLDTAAAEEHYRRALDLSEDEVERATVLAQLASVLSQRGQFGEAIELYERAIPVLKEKDRARAGAALRELGTATWFRGDADSARDLNYEAIAILEHDPGPELVAAYGSAAHRAGIAGRLDEAADLAEQGLRLAAALGVEDVMALTMARATVLGYSGDPECVTVSREARELGLRLGLGRSTAVATNNLAEAIYYYESIEGALAMWGEAIAFSRSRGIEEAVMWQGGERLKALYHLGRWDELVETGGEVLSWAQGQGGGQLEALVQIHLAEVLLHRGEIAEADRLVETLVPRARESGDPQVVVPGLSVGALSASVQGDRRTALRFVAELEELTRGSPGWRANCLVWPARIAIEANELDIVEALLEGVGDRSKWNAAARLGAEAALAEARGESAAATRLFREAASAWADMGSVVERAYALVGLGRCGDAQSRVEGEAIFARLGATPVLAKAA